MGWVIAGETLLVVFLGFMLLGAVKVVAEALDVLDEYESGKISVIELVLKLREILPARGDR